MRSKFSRPTLPCLPCLPQDAQRLTRRNSLIRLSVRPVGFRCHAPSIGHTAAAIPLTRSVITPCCRDSTPIIQKEYSVSSPPWPHTPSGPQTELALPTTAPDTTRDALADQGMEALKDVVFGSLAGVAGKYIEYPFDTVKVRLQSQPEHLPLRYTGPLDCFQKSWAKDGFIGLYRGISAPLVGAAVETSSLFFSYRVFQKVLQATVLPQNQPMPFTGLLFCGAASGAFTSTLLTPIELVKCKMQVPLETSSGHVVRMGPVGVISSVYRHQGLAGFWHGQLGTLIRETGGSAAWFGAYEGMGLFFRNLRLKSTGKAGDERLPIHQQMACGATAGMSYNFLFYPADTIKSRMQTEDVRRIAGEKRTFWSIGKLMWKQQGLRGMYRGCGITVARSAPSSAFIFTIYEALRQRFA